tara:strand:+ start:584 stop:763 length:180 start_codon:yes stop_codon:yes gene_type:complete
MESLNKLESKEAVELFVSTCKALIKDGVEEVSKELSDVHLDGKRYNFRISISAIDLEDI